MRQNITTLDVRQRLGELLDRVSLRRDQFIISRRGRPLAAMVPVEQLEHVQRAARLHLLEILEKPRSGISGEAADLIADQAKHKTRRRPRR